MAKTIFYSLAALVRKILFCHWKIKFISSRHRVIYPLYTTPLYLPIERFSYDLEVKTREQNRNNKLTEIDMWLVYRTDTNVRGFWLVKHTLGWKNFMPENFLEIIRYLAFPLLGFSLAGKLRERDIFTHWLTKQITNTKRNHFSRPYESRSNSSMFIIISMFMIIFWTSLLAH